MVMVILITFIILCFIVALIWMATDSDTIAVMEMVIFVMMILTVIYGCFNGFIYHKPTNRNTSRNINCC